MLKLITNPVGLASLSKREIVRFLTVAFQTIVPPWLSSLFFMYIFGVTIGAHIDLGLENISYIQFIVPGLMGMYLIVSSYENTSISLFIGRWHNNIQEILLSPLSYLEMVLGLLAGGLARGVIVCAGIFLVSLFFGPQTITHPFWLLYFMITLSTIFSCAGMLAALWAEDFRMLSLWNVYVISPLVLIGGVFHPLHLLPTPLKILSHINPLHYLISGMRYAVIGLSDQNVWVCAVIALGMAVLFGFITVYLFKAGYKLRT